MTFKIISIDEFGFNGRLNAPTDDMVGMKATPIKMTAHRLDTPEDIVPVSSKDAEDIAWVAEHVENDTVADCPMYLVWTCVLADRRVVALMDHEVELVEA